MNREDQSPECSGGGLGAAQGCSCDGNAHTCAPMIYFHEGAVAFQKGEPNPLPLPVRKSVIGVVDSSTDHAVKT
jgi:hypothetical protein